MAASAATSKDRQFLAVIGDEDSVTGLLLAGIGHVTDGPDSQKNFLVVDSTTETAKIEEHFQKFTEERNDIAIVLINQHIAERIRLRVDAFTDPFPAVLEIPSKDHPYDPEKDSVLKRVRRLFGE
ncbi:H(+)-transporting V1 sector ATPase subunit F [Penicillium brevicompactum]|uniref:H(+)-transporting V1 sector ATPase subunit F n=1 Tax=Penicillium brevicompactum TaxID=5074 RepID=UPI002542223F|nr:H(+)-transporting V1 sector ATPase subunit F [Penicillium brevicompactum]KAJ5334075.1 H(+)-transporting V1 sector ATPase subunit F [Penicillium brevicompactum]